jgi:cytochrome c-type biogenesis protein CcmH
MRGGGNRTRAVLLTLALLAAAPAAAVEPDEILADPVLEARARELSKDLRCLVCRNESIDDSNADLARDLRLLVRERLAVGDSEDEVLRYLVDRYGEFVLLKPSYSAANAAIWLAGPVSFLLGLGAIIAYLRARRSQAAANELPLSDAERKRLEEILKPRP